MFRRRSDEGAWPRGMRTDDAVGSRFAWLSASRRPWHNEIRYRWVGYPWFPSRDRWF